MGHSSGKPVYGHLPKTKIDLDRLMSALKQLASFEQPEHEGICAQQSKHRAAYSFCFLAILGTATQTF